MQFNTRGETARQVTENEEGGEPGVMSLTFPGCLSAGSGGKKTKDALNIKQEGNALFSIGLLFIP